jgi:hypothetical protein
MLPLRSKYAASLPKKMAAMQLVNGRILLLMVENYGTGRWLTVYPLPMVMRLLKANLSNRG